MRDAFPPAEHLPLGAYASFANGLEQSGWTNTLDLWAANTTAHKDVHEDTYGHWTAAVDYDHQPYVHANFSQRPAKMGKKALMKNIREFPAIAYYHSLNHSEYYESCLVSGPRTGRGDGW